MTDLIRSWVESANAETAEFPLNNLPYGVFARDGKPGRCCTAIGTHVLDLHGLEEAGVLDFGGTLRSGDWSAFMALGKPEWDRLRGWLLTALAEGAGAESTLSPHLQALSDVQLLMPFTVTEFTDFYASRHHASNVGRVLRGTNGEVPPNWLHIPIGYNGRASSVAVSGTDVRRPMGQLKAKDEAMPRFGPSERFDFELEFGAIVGQPSGGMIDVATAFDNIFGYVLLNDWSARDIQAWEFQPLGPFQSKAAATTISPWIVTAAALEPFRCAAAEREVPLLDYLQENGPMLYDVELEVALAPPSGEETVVTRSNYKHMYYSAAQQLTHHTTSGCPMRVGDLLGSGTISGPEKLSRGCMIELTWNGQEPVQLSSGETRAYIEDGDTVTIRGHAQGNGFRVGFGACSNRVVPSRG
ncbi:fumarylacetoacetase [Ponticoccus litoralis]|uniref:fumarylacetoacetase n=1 Tax=Ponticoccus litoralis TaxID=422297 RepID=A0AAW9SMP0_9RHOB